jgi:DNA-binding MarR family transcriptional regulator
LTDAGRECVSRLRATRNDRYAGWLAGMDEDDLEMLMTGLESLLPVADSAEAHETERNDR